MQSLTLITGCLCIAMSVLYSSAGSHNEIPLNPKILNLPVNKYARKISRISRRQAVTQVPAGKRLLEDAMIGDILRNAPTGATLLGVKPQELQPLLARLPDNATLIRENLEDNFRCTEGDRPYGYYADVDNECQVFHVCVPFHQIFKDNFTAPMTYQFSFICPEFTIFSQDVLTCAWSEEAVPCEYAEELYAVANADFFKIPEKTTVAAPGAVSA